MVRKSLLALGALASAGALSVPAQAQTLDTVRIASGLSDPIAIATIPGDERIFILEQPGRIKIWKPGVGVLAQNFASLENIVVNGSERGLLGMAFHPDYENNGYFYIHFSAEGGIQPGVAEGDTVIARMEVSSTNPDQANISTLQVLMSEDQPFSNHNGGAIHFGPNDGYLYIGLGDGGSGNDPGCRAQNLNSRLGKILRIDVDGAFPYAIPPTNPFAGAGGVQEEIWAYGIRNPWQWTFDSETGDIYIGDVGQDAREEISFIPDGVGGLNYGWRYMEGTRCNGNGNCATQGVPIVACNDPSLELPIHEYVHTGFSGPCTVVGGIVYRGCVMPDLRGTYFLADFCSNQIWSFRYDGTTLTQFTTQTAALAPGGGQSINSITAIDEDGFGELIIVDNGGELFKVVPGSPIAGADCDNNDQIDSCEIAENAALDLTDDGQLDACQTLSLTGSTGFVSIADGGTQVLSMDTAGAHPGDVYAFLGSVTGNSPGLPLDSVVAPIVFDAYTQLLLAQPGAVLTPLVGQLDGSGGGTAAWAIAPGAVNANFAGLSFYHCYIAFDAAFAVDFASNSVRVTLAQ